MLFRRAPGHVLALALALAWLGGVAHASELADREPHAFRYPALHRRRTGLVEAQGGGMNVSFSSMPPCALAALEYRPRREAGKAIKAVGRANPAPRITTVVAAPAETGCR